MNTSRLRPSALLACALMAIFLAGSPAAADDQAPPTASVAFTPSTAAPGTSVTISATVTLGTNPDITALGVNCDLSWAGLRRDTPLGPDATGLVFSRTFTVPSDTVPGGRVGSCTVTDGQLSSTTPYTFTVTSPETGAPPTVQANGPYSVPEGGSVTLGATGSDPEGGALTYAWDLDNNGTYETSGRTVTFSAAALDGASSQTVGVQVTDSAGATATDTATVVVTNVAPTAAFAAPATAFAGLPFTLSLTDPQDPSTADTQAGFTYSYDCGDETYGASASCSASDVTTLTVRGRIQDKDGGTTVYTATVNVTVTFDSLCALVRAYSTDPKVADDLCAKLATAAAASMPTAHDGALGSFRNQADAKVNKGLTADQAEELKRLSELL